MDKKIILASIFSLVILSAFVYAAILIGEREVLTCSDSDGGIDFGTFGNVSGITLGGSPYSRTDFCLNSNTAREYACASNATGVFVQLWSENCTCSGGVCID